MKANKIERSNHVVLIASIAAAVVMIGGLAVGYSKLRALYLEQCVVHDMPSQVLITSGKMVPPSTIAEEMGLKTGVNLAAVDFTEKRKQVLEKIPNLRTLRIARKLPDKVIITAEERTPIAKMSIKGRKTITGRVVDSEGMVFMYQRGTQTLPTIYEPSAPGTQRGQRIKGRTLAALRLIEACREPEFVELGILDVDTSKHDFLVVTLGNYSRVKILWQEMDESTPLSHSDLITRLTLLKDAIRSRVATDTVIWNATIPDRIFADTQSKF